MAYALVGSAGSQVVGAVSAAVSTEAYGQTPTANNLLVCFVGGAGVATAPTTPAGWSVGKAETGNSTSATIFYKVAAGSDAVPTIAALASQIWSVQLCEFSGNATTSPLDQTGGGTGTSSPVVATAGAVDALLGELCCFVGSELTSTSVTRTLTSTLNNGMSANVTGNNAATTATTHYSFGYGITTGNASADSDSMALSSTSKETGFSVAVASFKLLPLPPPPVYIRKIPQQYELLRTT